MPSSTTHSGCKAPGLTADEIDFLQSCVDATALSRSIQSLEKRNLVRAEGGRGRAGKRLMLTEEGGRLMARALP